MSAVYDWGKTCRDALEAQVDMSNLSCVLEALAVVCEEKAQHIESNWQDEALARRWRRAAKVVDRASGHTAVLVLP